jgi:hypothetical protein
VTTAAVSIAIISAVRRDISLLVAARNAAISSGIATVKGISVLNSFPQRTEFFRIKGSFDLVHLHSNGKKQR